MTRSRTRSSSGSTRRSDSSVSVPAVLIVDDDALIRQLIATTLEDVAGFELLEAANGQEAVGLAARDAPALVFLDIDMPGLDGIETCRRLRSLPGTAEATIVMLTAAAGDEPEREAAAAGADLFLTKPFSPLELLSLVDSLGARD
jgi:CheY-like chemotaxis protein